MKDYDRIKKVIHFLELNYKDQPSLATLADVAGLSLFHFQRLFRHWAGVTPKTFVKYLTAARAKELLRESKDLLTVSLESGLSGPGRLHDLIVSLEAVTPGELKSGGAGVEILYGFHETPFGDCLIGLTSRGVCHLSFIDGPSTSALAELKADWPKAVVKKSEEVTSKVVQKIFSKNAKKPIRVLVQGTSFQVKVWEALLSIPEGALVTYDHLATLSGSAKAARAVGSAVGKNSVAYLIPCHRVIRGLGVIGQYKWGSERKKMILNWEQGPVG